MLEMKEMKEMESEMKMKEMEMKMKPMGTRMAVDGMDRRAGRGEETRRGRGGKGFRWGGLFAGEVAGRRRR